MSGPARIVITGGGGNIGAKLVAHLLTREWCERIVPIDVRALSGGPFADPRVVPLQADVGDMRDARWKVALAEADAVVHLASANPAPNGSWPEATASFDQTENLLEHAGRRPRCRFVFASSNHVMGGYKDEEPGPGALTGSTPPRPGTAMFEGTAHVAHFPYGTTKLFGERAAIARAVATEGRLTAVSLRVGWCQPGENHPRTIVSGRAPHNPEEARDLAWFRNMWLSNRDLGAVFEAALCADASHWPAPGIVVNAVSANAGTPWDLVEAEALIGYRPKDDVWAALAAERDGNPGT